MYRRFLPIAVAILWEMAEVNSLFGAQITWTGTNNFEMNTTSNWSPAAIPGSLDDAIFDSTVSGVAATPTESVDTFSVSTLNFPHSASFFTLNFNNQTLELNGSGITGNQTNTTLNALNADNTLNLDYQVFFSGSGGSSSATSASAKLNISNSFTLSGTTSGANVGQITNDQLLSSIPFYVGSGASISVTNEGIDAITGTGNNIVCIIQNDQVLFLSDLFLDGNNTITILNSAANSGSKTVTSQVNLITGQFSVGGNLSAGDGLTITITNSGTDSSIGSASNYIASPGADQFYITGTTNLGNQALITIVNSGIFTGSSSSTAGSSTAGVGANQIEFAGVFTALDGFSLDVLNTGTNTSSGYGGNTVGSLNLGQVLFGSSVTTGSGASITIRQHGNSSGFNTNAGNTVGSSGAGVQLNVSGGFSTGDNFTLILENRGVLTGSLPSVSGDIVANSFGQSTFGSFCHLGNNATINIANSGLNSSDTPALASNVGSVGPQMSVNGPFIAMDNLAITINNSGNDSSSGLTSNNYLANSGFSQLECGSSFDSLQNASIHIANTGTITGSNGGYSNIANIGLSQVDVTGDFSVGDGFLLHILNTGVDSGTGIGHNALGVVGNSQLILGGTTTAQGSMDISILNSGTSSGSSTASGNSVGYLGVYQFHQIGPLNATDNFTLNVANTGLYNGAGYGANSIGYINNLAQVVSDALFTVGNNATIAVSNHGVNSGSVTNSSNYVALVSNYQASFSGGVRAGDYLVLSVTNSGEDSCVSSGSGANGDNVGYMYYAQLQSGSSFGAGDHASITVSNTGINSSNIPSVFVGYVGDSQFYTGSNSFTAGDYLTLRVANSGNDSCTGSGGNYVGVVNTQGTGGIQVGCGAFDVGDNATIAISNSGTNSGSGANGDNVGYVYKDQFSVQDSLIAGNDFTLRIENSGVNSNTVSNSNNVGVIANGYQMHCLSTVQIGDNATISISNSGTDTSITTGNAVGSVSQSQLVVSDTFQSGTNLLLSVTNSALNSGNPSNTVGSVGNSQIVFNGTCTLGDGSVITAFNSGTVGGLQMQFAQGFDITSGSITLAAINQGTLSGSGIQIDAGSGGNARIVLAGNSLYIGSAAADFTIGSLSGDSACFVQSSPTLTIDTDPSVSATFFGEIQDYPLSISALIKTGAGRQTLSGTNTYTGTTYIQQGILSINGSVIGDVIVSSGGSLKGSGTIGGVTTIDDGATLSPGNSIGTINLNSLILNPASTTVMEIDPSDSSKVLVATSATVDGALQIVQDPGAYAHQGSYRILGAGSLIGTFASMNSVPGFAFSLSTVGNDIYLNYLLEIATDGLSGNSLTLASYLNDNAPPSSAFTYLAGLSGEALTEALERISPSRNAFGTYITAQTAFSLSNLVSMHLDSFRVSAKEPSQDSFVSVLTADSSGDIAAPVKSKGSKNRFSSWVAGLGEFAHQAALSQNPSFNYISGAALIGLDYRGENRAMAGGSLGYAHTHYTEAQSAGHGNINAYFASIYGNAFVDNFYFSPTIWGVFNQIDNTRNISYPGFSAKAHSDIFSWQMIPHLEVGYDFSFSWGDLIPFTSADWAICWQRGYQEQGASAFNAKQRANNSSMVRSETGFKFSEKWEKSWGAFILKEKASYVFEKPFGTGSVNTSFVGMPGAFTVVAVNRNLNLGALGLNFLVAIGKEKPVKVDLGYEGEFGSNFWSNDLMITFSKDF